MRMILWLVLGLMISHAQAQPIPTAPAFPGSDISGYNVTPTGGTATITAGNLAAAECTNSPGLCSKATVVSVACGTTLSTVINGSSTPGTIYQLAGSAASPCTYSLSSGLTPVNNITIQGDCSSPIGSNTIIDGGGNNFELMNGLSTSVTGVKIKCMTIQHINTHVASYCGGTTGATHGSIVIWDGWVIKNSSIIDNGCFGIWSQGAAQLIHNYIARNANGGVIWQPDGTALSGYAANGLVLGNEFDSNGNTSGTDNAGVIAGIKVASDHGCSSTKVPAATGVRIMYNYVHDTQGTSATVGATGADGIWTDCETSNTTIEGNTVVHNGFAGIHLEISVGVEVSHNVMIDNDWTDVAGNSNSVGCLYVNTSSNVNIHDNYCKVNTAYGNGMAIQAACRTDAPAASAIGNIKNVWVRNNTIAVVTTNGSTSPFQGIASWAQDDTTASGSTSYGALCSGDTHPAGANWNVFANNTYYLQATGTTAFSANSCGVFPNFSLSQIQGASGNTCLSTPNYPNDLGSSVTAYPAAMAAVGGCTMSASSGQFCDQQGGPPW